MAVRRRRSRGRLVLSLVVALTWGQRPARAVPGGEVVPHSTRVHVECPLFPEATRAALAARLTGELLLSATSSELYLECSQSVLVARLELEGVEQIQTRPLAPNEDVSELLLELGLLMIEDTAFVADESPDTEKKPEELSDTPEPTPTVPLVPRLVSPASTAGSSLQPAQTPSKASSYAPHSDEEPPVSPTEASSVASSNTERPSVASSSNTEKPSSVPPAAAKRRGRRIYPDLYLRLSGEYQHWGRQVPGALGPHVGIGTWTTKLGIELFFAPYIGLNKVNGYAAVDLRWQLSLIGRPFEWMRVGVGPLVSWISASGPATAEQGKTNSVRPGVDWFGEGLLQLDRWFLSLRVGVSILAAARSVEENEVPEITIPRAQPHVGLGVAFVFDPVEAANPRLSLK